MSRAEHRPSAEPAAPRSRVRMLVAAPAIVALGLALRFGLPDVLADPLGGVCYAVLVYVLVAFFAPRGRSLVIGGVALAACVAVELFQLTSVPARMAEAVPAAALVLGSGFSAADLPPYLIGTVVAVLLDPALRPSREAAPRR